MISGRRRSGWRTKGKPAATKRPAASERSEAHVGERSEDGCVSGDRTRSAAAPKPTVSIRGKPTTTNEATISMPTVSTAKLRYEHCSRSIGAIRRGCRAAT